jgi:YD repeat-containing protein
MNRLTNLTNKQTTGGTTLSSFAYTHYADGMRHTLTESVDEGRTITYTYDNLNRVTGEEATNGSYGYTATYEYDLAGNRTRRQVQARNSTSCTTLETTYDYSGDSDQLLSETFDVKSTTCLILPERQIYAHYANGDVYYTAGGMTNRISSVRAFMMGLPTRWGPYALRTVLALLPIAFLIPLVTLLITRLRKATVERPQLSLLYRCLSVMLAYMMLISPVCLQQLAEADVQYASINVSAWGEDNRVIEYGQWDGSYTVFTPGYDDNGNLVRKIKWDTHDSVDHSAWTQVEDVQYEYNLQNRLVKITPYDAGGNPQTSSITTYKYDPEGNRVERKVGPAVAMNYLVDSYNHTGYPQVFVARQGTGTKTAHIIGDDILAQAFLTSAPKYLLYDGHGSTRQLTNSSGSVEVDQSYSYDAYGVRLRGTGSAIVSRLRRKLSVLSAPWFKLTPPGPRPSLHPFVAES